MKYNLLIIFMLCTCCTDKNQDTRRPIIRVLNETISHGSDKLNINVAIAVHEEGNQSVIKMPMIIASEHNDKYPTLRFLLEEGQGVAQLLDHNKSIKGDATYFISSKGNISKISKESWPIEVIDKPKELKSYVSSVLKIFQSE